MISLLFAFSGGLQDVIAWKGDVSSLEGQKGDFNAYYCFVTKWVYVKVDLEDVIVIPIIAICDLWDLRYYIEMLCSDVFQAL